MRPDQMQRLQALSERLADRFLADADPDTWTAADKVSRDMTTEERGDAYWCRKVAMSTGGVLNFVLNVMNNADGRQSNEANDDALEQQVAAAEKRAAAAVKAAMAKAKG